MKSRKLTLLSAIFLPFSFLLMHTGAGAQSSNGMHVKKNDFTTFHQPIKGKNIESWKKLNDKAFYNHPDFGTLTKDAPCTECVEDLSRRTNNYRYFIDVNDNSKFYSQSSIGDMNLQKGGFWREKDVSIVPQSTGIYESKMSFQKTGIDVNTKRTYIETEKGKIYFNNWILVGLNGEQETLLASPDWSNYTVGDDGIYIRSVFSGIDAQIEVRDGGLKTSFIMHKNLFQGYEQLLFRDQMSAGSKLDLSFQNGSSRRAIDGIFVKMNGQELLQLTEAFAFSANVNNEDRKTLNYQFNTSGYDVMVPSDWVNSKIAISPVVIDPLVTGTATLAQASINGSQYNGSCNINNWCDYNLVVPTPAQATLTDVMFSFTYRAQGLCFLNDGALMIRGGGCTSPAQAGYSYYCNDYASGTCAGTNVSIFADVAGCMPAPSCIAQNVTFTLRFGRSCYGASGCSNTCIGAASPFVVAIEGKTLEFTNTTTPITSATTVCQGQSLTVSTSGAFGVAPYTYNWSFDPSGTPSLATTASTSVTFPTAGPQTIYSVVKDACGNTQTSSKVITVTTGPVATATPASQTICSGGITNIALTSSPAATSYSWTVVESGVTGATAGSGATIAQTLTSATGGTATYTITPAGACPGLPITVVITVNPAPTATAGSNSPICEGGTLNLTGNTVAGATYGWTGPNGFTSALQNPTISGVTTAAAGTYTFSVTSPGCPAVTSTVTVVVNPAPVATAGSNSPICTGTALNLTANTVTGATYGWTGPNGFTSPLQNPTIGSATVPAAGTYTVTITAPGCTAVTSTVTVVVNPGPTATAGSNSPICEGTALNLTANTVAGATYGWTGPNGFTSALQNPTITATTTAAAGTYTLTITSPGCTAVTSTITVVVNAAPTASAGSNSPICAGSALNLTANTVTGATYGWTGPNGFTSASQNPTITAATAAAAGTYTLTITVPGCTAVTSTVTVVVNPGPTATAGSNTPICEGSALNLTANTVTGATYGWTGPNGFTSALQNPTITVATATASGTYTLTITSPGCTAVTSTVTVVVNAAPTASAGSNSPICAGSALNLTANTVTGATYGWTGPNGFTSASQNPTITAATAAAAGTYTLTITTPGCTAATSTVTVVVNPGPTVTAGSNSPICAGSALNLTGNTIAGATYGWTGPNGFTSALQNPTIPAATTSAAGTYTLSVTTPGCTAVTSTVTVVVNAAPTATAGSNSPVCTGSTLNLTANTIAGATYDWTGPNGFTSALQNPTIASVTATAAGTYTLTITTASCTPVTSTVTVVINNGGVVTITKTDVTCNGLANGTATANSSLTGTHTYAWSPSGGTGQIANNLAPGTYTVTVSTAGCNATGTVTIVQPSAITVTTNATQSSCAGATGTATAVAAGGTAPYTYAWSPSGGTAATATGLAAGTYTVTITDATLCTKTATVNVTSANPPTVTIASKTDVTCFGAVDGKATASTTGGTAPYTYVWSPSGGTAATANGLTAGIYTVAVTDNAGCSSSVTVTINAASEIILTTSGTSSQCETPSGTVAVVATGGGGSYTYQWNPGSQTTAAISNVPAGNYSVIVKDVNGCTQTASYQVGQISGLNIQINPITSTIFEGETVGLNATLTPYIPGILYVWTPPSSLSCADCPNPVASPMVTTTYTVTIITPNGCIDSLQSVVNVKMRCGDHFIPTAFSPNGDGNNDYFKVYGKCVGMVDMEVFNRWGEVVYKSNDNQYGWDGTYNGKDMNSGSFIYSAKITFLDGTYILDKGSVSLTR